MTPKGIATHRLRAAGLLVGWWDLAYKNLFLSSWGLDVEASNFIFPNTCPAGSADPHLLYSQSFRADRPSKSDLGNNRSSRNIRLGCILLPATKNVVTVSAATNVSVCSTEQAICHTRAGRSEGLFLLAELYFY